VLANLSELRRLFDCDESGRTLIPRDSLDFGFCGTAMADPANEETRMTTKIVEVRKSVMIRTCFAPMEKNDCHFGFATIQPSPDHKVR
jgi:hypothetical protein